MGGDQDITVQMPDPFQKPACPLNDCRQLFHSLRRRIVHKIAEKADEFLRQMRQVCSLKGTVIHLDQELIDHRLQTRHNNFSSLHGAAERTGKNIVKADIPQPVRGLPGLADPLFIEGYIAPPLQKIGMIHCGFSMPDNIDHPHFFTPAAVSEKSLRISNCIFRLRYFPQNPKRKPAPLPQGRRYLWHPLSHRRNAWRAEPVLCPRH